MSYLITQETMVKIVDRVNVDNLLTRDFHTGSIVESTINFSDDYFTMMINVARFGDVVSITKIENGEFFVYDATKADVIIGETMIKIVVENEVIFDIDYADCDDKIRHAINKRFRDAFNR